ncbi:MAG: MBL fold metallo-hydrolase [Desulfotalea sp.]
MNSLYKLDGNVWVNDIELEDFEVRSVLICDQNNAVIWDTLSHPDDINCYLPIIKDKKLTIIYSHADWDHIWGSCGLPYSNAEIIGHELCLGRFNDDVPTTLLEKKLSDPLRYENIKLVSPTKIFSNDLDIYLDKTILHLHHLPGHTLDSIVAFLPEQGILLMGDTVETPFPFVPEKCQINRWIEKLQKWENDIRVNTVIPSHGPIGGREIITENINYLRELKEDADITLPEGVTDFYNETHEENVRNIRNLSKILPENT